MATKTAKKAAKKDTGKEEKKTKKQKSSLIQEISVDEKVLKFDNYKSYRELSDALKILNEERDKIGNEYLTSETIERNEYLKQRSVLDNKIKTIQRVFDETESKLKREMKADDDTFKECILKFIIIFNGKPQYVNNVDNSFVLTDKEQAALFTFLIEKAKEKERFVTFIDIAGKKCQVIGFNFNNICCYAMFSNVIKNVGFQKMEKMSRQFTKVVLSGEATYELFNNIFSKMLGMSFFEE